MAFGEPGEDLAVRGNPVLFAAQDVEPGLVVDEGLGGQVEEAAEIAEAHPAGGAVARHHVHEIDEQGG